MGESMEKKPFSQEPVVREWLEGLDDDRQWSEQDIERMQAENREPLEFNKIQPDAARRPTEGEIQ